MMEVQRLTPEEVTKESTDCRQGHSEKKGALSHSRKGFRKEMTNKMQNTMTSKEEHGKQNNLHE